MTFTINCEIFLNTTSKLKILQYRQLIVYLLMQISKDHYDTLLPFNLNSFAYSTAIRALELTLFKFPCID